MKPNGGELGFSPHESACRNLASRLGCRELGLNPNRAGWTGLIQASTEFNKSEAWNGFCNTNSHCRPDAPPTKACGSAHQTNRRPFGMLAVSHLADFPAPVLARTSRVGHHSIEFMLDQAAAAPREGWLTLHLVISSRRMLLRIEPPKKSVIHKQNSARPARPPTSRPEPTAS